MPTAAKVTWSNLVSANRQRKKKWPNRMITLALLAPTAAATEPVARALALPLGFAFAPVAEILFALALVVALELAFATVVEPARA
jgi:hypothetical protein